MKEFYEPILYMSTPEHPSTMGMIAVLREPVDGRILWEVVQELRERFPYFYVKAAVQGYDLIPVPNALPMTVRNTWDPIHFNSEASGFHLAAWKYEGKRMAFEISHSLTDGAGVFPYVKSVLFLYLSRKTGQAFDPAGFRLPGDVIPESETGNPFAGIDIEGAEAPLYSRDAVKDFYRLNKEEKNDPQITYLKLSEDQLMQYCKDYDGSPNAFLSVIFARAVRRYDPKSEKTISIAIAVDHKAMLGNYDNYHMCASVVEVEFPGNRSLDDLMKSCTIVRGQVMLQAQPENSIWAMKQRSALCAKMDQMPLDMKLGIMEKTAGSPRWSLSISYANSRSFGPLDPYIDELYLLAEPGVSDIVCEISCINHHFFLAIAQTFVADEFVGVFIEELAAVGITCEVTSKEPLRLCGLERYGTAGS